MKYVILGLGGRLRGARSDTGLNYKAVDNKIGVSWINVRCWESPQCDVPGSLLERRCERYDKPHPWFLAFEDRNLNQPSEIAPVKPGRAFSASADRLCRKIGGTAVFNRQMIERGVGNLLDRHSRVG